ncbi:methyltransferase-like protein 24 isoform X2 [Aplysia californica]|uniref:Methyltransferase-like protein 24 isoform X2 n=1 Tax=Aplysia californica TaxID=6500 RepID=A0ABM0K307_APLCA|nr:methyltransferase-like protein 24 isoform X2 [Aplysia californica]
MLLLLLKKFDGREIDLNYIRSIAVVDFKISQFTDPMIAEMNETELMAHVHSYLDNIDTICKRKLRMGYVGDGGWEICDDSGIRPKQHDCLVYSFGVVNEFSFEDDVSRLYDCEVHSFNPLASGDDYNRSKKIQAHSFSIGRNSEISEDGKELYTLPDIRTILHHSKNNIDVMKMDIEGAEWPALAGMLQFDELSQVKQLLVEFHLGPPPNIDRLRRALKVLKDIGRAGLRKFYATKNPRGSFHHPGFPVMRARNYEIHFLNTKFLNK